MFCLSLMGTDYTDFLREAHRVLTPSGRLWIAEVSTVAEGLCSLGPDPATHSLCVRPAVHCAWSAGSGYGPASQPLASHLLLLLPQLTQQRTAGQQMQCSVRVLSCCVTMQVRSRFTGNSLERFSSALEALGFRLESEDTSNKMFVVLAFAKTGAVADAAEAPWPELKPCLYKHR